MKLVPVDFCTADYRDKSPNVSSRHAINLIPIIDLQDPRTARIVMQPTPGRLLFKDLSGNSVRGLYTLNNVLYAVCDSTFYSVDSSGNLTTLGTLLTSSGQIDILDNTVQIVINDRTYIYTYNLSSGVFARVTDANYPSAGFSSITYHDGYVLGAQNNSRRIYQTSLFDASTFPNQAFTDVSTYTDNLTAVFSDQRELYALGAKGTEVRFDAGDTPFAFERVNNVAIQTGCASSKTLRKLDNSFIWLSQNQRGGGHVVKLDGYTPQIISSPALNETIERYSTISDAIAWTYKEADNDFYVLTFPTANATWVWNAATKFWHQLSDFNVGRDIANAYAYCYGKHIVGDYASGKLYYWSQDYLDNNGGIIQRQLTTKHFDANGAMIFLYELQVDIENGVGLNSGQGSDPLATLEISRDGGNTWHTAGVASMGKLGQYRKRLIWRQLGNSYMFTFRVTISDPVRTYIIGARAGIKLGNK